MVDGRLGRCRNSFIPSELSGQSLLGEHKQQSFLRVSLQNSQTKAGVVESGESLEPTRLCYGYL